MTFNPETAARLIQEAREDDERMNGASVVRVQWEYDDCRVRRVPDNGGFTVATVIHPQEGEAIARTRNNLTALAEQLAGAVEEVERYRAFEARHSITVTEIEHPDMEWCNRKAIEAIRAQLSAARAECEVLKKERDEQQRTIDSGNEAFRRAREQWNAEVARLTAENEKMRAVCEAAKRVVSERRAKIMHARESAAMCQMQQAIDTALSQSGEGKGEK